jgi:hypothetical protein
MGFGADQLAQMMSISSWRRPGKMVVCTLGGLRLMLAQAELQ